MFCTCEKCGRTMDEKNFYTTKTGDKTKLCKKCLTMHIDNFKPETFLWILEDLDVPYVEEEWNIIRDKAFAKNPNLNGMSVLGKYLSKMKLKQWHDYGWADSESLKNVKIKREEKESEAIERFEAQLKAQYEKGEISEAQYNTLMSTETLHEDFIAEGAASSAPPPEAVEFENPYDEENFISEDELVDLSAELTDDDKKYLAMKWGRLYKPNDWVKLEQKYDEMTKSFEIEDSDTIGTLIIICKTYLKMNDAIDIGDLDGFQKLSRVYDTLRKSAKFTAAQNKEDKKNFVDCIGELVVLCEKEGFIPRYCTDVPQDKIDFTLKDMNNFTRKLVTEDLGFGQQIENALKKIEVQKELQEEEDSLEEEFDNELLNPEESE